MEIKKYILLKDLDIYEKVLSCFAFPMAYNIGRRIESSIYIQNIYDPDVNNVYKLNQKYKVMSKAKQAKLVETQLITLTKAQFQKLLEIL